MLHMHPIGLIQPSSDRPASSHTCQVVIIIAHKPMLMELNCITLCVSWSTKSNPTKNAEGLSALRDQQQVTSVYHVVSIGKVCSKLACTY
jgi:hypothetical protein